MQAPTPIPETAADPANDLAVQQFKVVSTAAEYVAVVEQSRLVSDSVMAELRALLRAQPDAKPLSLAARLVRDEHLTTWQTQQLLAGKTQFFLGRYKFLDRLGLGGMGAVFKAEHEIMGRVVALKMIRRRMLEDQKTRDGFLREIRATARLTDPNIVTAYDADHVGNVYFLVMEYVDGKDLGWWVEQKGPFSPNWACEFCRQTALGLQHAHTCGLVHRDIKPTNLLVDSQPPHPPVIKILDFGLSQLATDEARFDSQANLLPDAEVSTVSGTFGFMAPEQFRQPPQSDIRSDIFSLGCTLFYLLTGQLPFPASSDRQYISSLMRGEATSARSLKADVPEAVEQVLRKALAKNPDDRYQTPREFADALLPLSASAERTDSAAAPLSAPLPSSVATPPPLSPKALAPTVDAALGEFDVSLTSGPVDIFNLNFDQVSAADPTSGMRSLPSPFDHRKRQWLFDRRLLRNPLFWSLVAVLAILIAIVVASCIAGAAPAPDL